MLYDFTIAIKIMADNEEEAEEMLQKLVIGETDYELCDIAELESPGETED